MPGCRFRCSFGSNKAWAPVTTFILTLSERAQSTCLKWIVGFAKSIWQEISVEGDFTQLLRAGGRCLSQLPSVETNLAIKHCARHRLTPPPVRQNTSPITTSRECFYKLWLDESGYSCAYSVMKRHTSSNATHNTNTFVVSSSEGGETRSKSARLGGMLSMLRALRRARRRCPCPKQVDMRSIGETSRACEGVFYRVEDYRNIEGPFIILSIAFE